MTHDIEQSVRRTIHPIGRRRTGMIRTDKNARAMKRQP